jgi:hypothetical protein
MIQHLMAVAAMEQIWLVYRIAEHSATIELADSREKYSFFLPVLYTLLYSAYTWGITSYSMLRGLKQRFNSIFSFVNLSIAFSLTLSSKRESVPLESVVIDQFFIPFVIKKTG